MAEGKVRKQFFVTTQLGPKQSVTPEGFLLCEDVPVARTGMMVYGPDEVPIDPGPDGTVKIFRHDEEVFSSKTIASINGKSVVDDHPEEDVNIHNWKELTVGMGFNPRRGKGAEDDLLMCDLLITVPSAIQAVKDGKREISLGYDADYVPTGVGSGYQRDILVNHIALVESGRCGLRCAIGDKQTINPEERKEQQMSVRKSMRRKLLDHAVKNGDSEAFEKALEMKDEGETETGEPSGETHVHVHLNGESKSTPTTTEVTDDEEGEVPGLKAHIEQNAKEHAEMREAITKLQEEITKLQGAGGSTDSEAEKAEEKELEKEVADEVPEEKKEEASKMRDSAYMADGFRETIALAEILVPGITVPTFDSKDKPTASVKKLCAFRKKAIDLAYAQPATRDIIEELLNGKSISSVRDMSCSAARNLFSAAGAIRRRMNNDSQRSSGQMANGNQTKKPAVTTLAELNAKNKAHWNGTQK